MRLERFKIQKFSNPGKGDTPFPGPYPPQPRPFGPRRVQPHPKPRPFGPRRILAPPWQKASCAYAYISKLLIDLVIIFITLKLLIEDIWNF